jgi:hypothetical protein
LLIWRDFDYENSNVGYDSQDAEDGEGINVIYIYAKLYSLNVD